MSRYVIQFYKKDTMRYISHLDLLKLFKRTFKRTGIKLHYSQGFNPHPKMSFVQPLSLGYASLSEYLEIETVQQLDETGIMATMNEAMPKGVGIISCRQLPPSNKTLAAMVESALYHISAELSDPDSLWKEKLDDFLSEKEIIVEKKQKKTGKMVQQNIRLMIKSLTIDRESAVKSEEDNGNYITLTAWIAAGSNCNLNPEVMLSAFCKFCGISYLPESISVTRRELYFPNEATGDIRPILEYESKQ